MNQRGCTIKAAFLVAILLLLSGCMDQMLYEDIGFILQVGLELDKEDNFVYSLTYPIVSENATENVGFLSTSSYSLLRASKEELRDQSSKKLLPGKCQHILYSKQLAQRGIGEYLEIFVRNPENPMQANVMVVDGSPKEMMALSFGFSDKPRVSFYINDVINDSRDKATASEARLYTVTILQNAKTIDPYIPLLKYNEKIIELKGSALLDGDKMVGEIDKEQTFLLNLLTGNKKAGRYTIEAPVPGEELTDTKQGMAVMLFKAKRKLTVKVTDGEKPRTLIKLKMKARVEESDAPHYMEQDEMKKQIEDLLANSIREDCAELVRILMKTGSDPLGLEEIVRSRNNAIWKTMNWEEKYKEMQFQIEVQVTVESYGVMS